jgi:large subunit ribosomal protein L22
MSKSLEIVSSATLRGVRVSPRKARLVADMLRGELAGEALRRLQFCRKKSAPILQKVLMSAVANAKETNQIDVDSLIVSEIKIDMGRSLKRHLPRAQGRASNIKKRSSHIMISLGIAS